MNGHVAVRIGLTAIRQRVTILRFPLCVRDHQALCPILVFAIFSLTIVYKSFGPARSNATDGPEFSTAFLVIGNEVVLDL
jgi:hypothetical protein